MKSHIDHNEDQKTLLVECRQLGLDYWALETIKRGLSDPENWQGFSIDVETVFGPDRLRTKVNMGVGQDGQLHIVSFNGLLRKGIDVPDLIIADINTLDLKRKMDLFDWSIDLDSANIQMAAQSDPLLKDQIREFGKIKNDLQSLNDSAIPNVKEVVEALTNQHWLGTTYEKYIPDAKKEKIKFDTSYTFDRADIFWPNLVQAKNLLKGYYVGRSLVSPLEGKPVVEWFRLNSSYKAITGQVVYEGLGSFDLERHISILPTIGNKSIPEVQFLYESLVNGEKPFVHYPAGKFCINARLSLDASCGFIEIQDEKGKIIDTTAGVWEWERRIKVNDSVKIINKNTMSNKNFSESNYDYNIERLRKHLFPDTKNDELKDQMQQGKNRILLEFRLDDYYGLAKATWHVERAQSGTYFPNRYQLEFKKPNSTYVRNQFFQVENFKGHENKFDIPWKMGLALLKGGQVLNHWLQEDKTSVHEWRGLNFSERINGGYGFVSFDAATLDVAKKLQELPIKEGDKSDLRHSAVIRSLEMGNIQTVHLDTPDNLAIRLRANVRKGDLDVYRGGQVLSIMQFNTELSELKDPGVVFGVNGAENGRNSQIRPEGPGKGNSKEIQPSQSANSTGIVKNATGERTSQQAGKAKEVSPASNESAAKSRTSKILHGNQITGQSRGSRGLKNGIKG